MGSHNLPSPPAEDPKAALSRKSTSSSTKSTKPANRISKRAGSTGNAAHAHHHDHVTQGAGMDARHKRVWKACERCRMKKTKCDGEFPCKRCKDDGLVCTAGVRKKMEYKQLPKGYAEVLENTQFALIATVHKLYSMVRSNQSWDLGEPELNDRGQPVIHDIAQKLGCIRPNSDIDLPVHSVFPEDERGMHELALQLEEQQRLEDANGPEPMSAVTMTSQNSSSAQSFTRASSDELDHSDFETDYRAAAFGGANKGNMVSMSPQSFTTTNTDFDFGPSPDNAAMFPPAMAGQSTKTSSSSSQPSPAVAQFPNWSVAPSKNDPFAMQFMQHQAMSMPQLLSQDEQQRLMSQGFLESDFGTLKPHVLSGDNSGAMMGIGDPMIFSADFGTDI